MAIDFEVIFTKKARRQVEEIYKYIALNLHNDPAAKKLMQKIDSTVRNLAKFPDLHPVSRMRKYRKCVIDGYLLFYKVDKKNKAVYVMAVYHALQNYGRLF